MSRWMGALALAVVLGATACSDSDSFQPSPTIVGSPPLALHLDIPDDAHTGEPIALKLILTNPGDGVVTYTSGVPWVNFTLTDSSGATVWPDIEGYLPSLQTHTFAPGQDVEFTNIPEDRLLVDENDEPLPPGDYLVQGHFHTSDVALRSRPAQLTILP